MSLITRCPACETMFKVVPDQLRISSGWVRCGQCAEIFDASQHLLPAAGAAAPPAPPPSPPAEPPVPAYPATVAHSAFTPPQDTPFPSQDAEPMALQDDPAFTEATAHNAATTQAHSAMADTWPGAPANATESIAAEPAVQVAHNAPTDVQLPDTLSPPHHLFREHSDRQTFAPLALPSEPLPMPEHTAPAMATEDAPTPSFMRGAQRPSFWQRPALRILLLVLLILLLLALAAQALLQERDRVATFAPATRPLLLTLCAWTGCSLSPLREIEAIVIDDSSFGRIRDDNYRLTVGIRNTAKQEIGMPALELALTNAQDQTLVRRVILSAEFPAPATALAAGGEWSGTLALRIPNTAASEPIASYHLFAFYP